MVPRHVRKARRRWFKFYRRRETRRRLRQARRIQTIVNARKATVYAVVVSAIVVLVGLGATGALVITRLVHG